MKRIALTDDTGRWFDKEKATEFTNDDRDRINNTWLYYTASGKWILNEWSRYEGSEQKYVEIDSDAAAKWLIENGYGDNDILKDKIEALEI